MTKKPEHSIANMKYERHCVEIDKEIKLLQAKLKSHKVKQKTNPSSYGYSGDAEYILCRLQEINQFLN